MACMSRTKLRNFLPLPITLNSACSMANIVTLKSNILITIFDPVTNGVKKVFHSRLRDGKCLPTKRKMEALRREVWVFYLFLSRPSSLIL
jgi:hypothetical protein